MNSFETLVLSSDYETVLSYNNNKESCVSRLVRTSCKGGSDECGVASYFNSFLAGSGQKSLFAPFIGNHFNILYYNADVLYQ